MLVAIKRKVAELCPWLVPVYRSAKRRYVRVTTHMTMRYPRLNFLIGQSHLWRRLEYSNIDDKRSLAALAEVIAKDNARTVPGAVAPRFVLITHGLSSGGAERQWCYLARALAVKGYAVDLLVLDLDGQNRHYLHLLAGTGVQVHNLKTFRVPTGQEGMIPGLTMGYQVTHLSVALAALNPTHILCQLDWVNVQGGVAAFFSGADIQKVLFSFRNLNPSHFPHFYCPWMLDYYREFCKSKRVVLSGNSRVGNDDYANWIGVPSESIRLTPNAFIPPANLQADRADVRRALNIDMDAPVIVGVFRLSPEKNPVLFVDVVARLKKQFPGLTTLHLGAGQMTSRMKQYAEDKGLGDAIRFLGSRSDSQELIGAADLMLLCSNFEGLPNVVLEAQNAGVPVVATRAGSTAEAMIDGETGFLAEIGGEDALVEHGARLLRDTELRKRMGEAGREFVRRTFTVERLCETVLSALDSGT